MLSFIIGTGTVILFIWLIINRVNKSDKEKFYKLSLPVLGVDKAGQVAKKIINLEEIRDLDEITQMLR